MVYPGFVVALGNSNVYTPTHRTVPNDFSYVITTIGFIEIQIRAHTRHGPMTLSDLWFLADEADQRAAQAYHDLATDYEATIERTRCRRVSRRRFRVLAERIHETGAPYGAHTIVHRPSGDLLLCRHEGVGLWVLPGGGVEPGEGFREAAARELDEEAGIEARYDGLGIITRVELRCEGTSMWGVLPVFVAAAETTEPAIRDPDDEISSAEWFADLPDDTRDREDLLAWRERAL